MSIGKKRQIELLHVSTYPTDFDDDGVEGFALGFWGACLGESLAGCERSALTGLLSAAFTGFFDLVFPISLPYLFYFYVMYYFPVFSRWRLLESRGRNNSLYAAVTTRAWLRSKSKLLLSRCFD